MPAQRLGEEYIFAFSLCSTRVLLIFPSLQVASTFADAFDALLDAYQDIGENIPLLAQYESLFKDNPHMYTVLELIYTDILEFHRKALSYFKQRSKF